MDKNFFGYAYRLCFSVFFGTCQRESPLTQSSLHIFLGLEYLQYDVTHHLFSNGIISQELGWWFQTLHKAARVSPEHMARSRVGYGENMLRGCRKIMVYDVPIILGHIYHQIHQSNITFCVFAFLSMNLTSTLGKVTSGPPETLFGGLVPTHWQSGVLAGLPRAVWACSGAENDRFRPCSTNKLRLFLGGVTGYQFRTQTLVDVC